MASRVVPADAATASAATATTTSPSARALVTPSFHRELTRDAKQLFMSTSLSFSGFLAERKPRAQRFARTLLGFAPIES
jgi:hypothetical protein